MKRKCQNCDKSIDHKHPNAKFCRTKCKDKFHNRNNPRGYGVSWTECCDTDYDRWKKGADEASFDPGWDGHKDTF